MESYLGYEISLTKKHLTLLNIVDHSKTKWSIHLLLQEIKLKIGFNFSSFFLLVETNIDNKINSTIYLNRKKLIYSM